MRALRESAQRNQDRVKNRMTFTFTSDQDENRRQVVTFDQQNWFDLQQIEVGIIYLNESVEYHTPVCLLLIRPAQL